MSSVPVFAVMGHGCDFVGPEERRIIPPGCMLITATLHGEASSMVPKLYQAFLDPLLFPALLHPNRESYRRVLLEYFQFSPETGTDLFLHEEGDTYQNGKVLFWSETGPPVAGVWKSGLYSLGDAPHPFDHGDFFMTRAEYEADPEAVREQSYEGSLILPHRDVHGSIVVHPPVQRTYEEMMNERPGIYYVFSCRVPCETPPSSSLVALTRTQSRLQHQARGRIHALESLSQPAFHPLCGMGMAYFHEWLDDVAHPVHRARWEAQLWPRSTYPHPPRQGVAARSRRTFRRRTKKNRSHHRNENRPFFPSTLRTGGTKASRATLRRRKNIH